MSTKTIPSLLSRRALLALSLAAAASIGSGAPLHAADPIKIGFIGSL